MLLHAILECLAISPKPQFIIPKYRVSDTNEGILVFKKEGHTRYGVLIKKDGATQKFAIKITADSLIDGGLNISKVEFDQDVDIFTTLAGSLNHIKYNGDLECFKTWEQIADAQLLGVQT